MHDQARTLEEDKRTNVFILDNVALGCADSVQLNTKQEGRFKIDIRKTGGQTPVVLAYGESENMIQITPTGRTQYNIYSKNKSQKKTEFVPLTAQQLSYLGKQDVYLAPIFEGVFAASRTNCYWGDWVLNVVLPLTSCDFCSQILSVYKRSIEVFFLFWRVVFT